MPKTEVLSPRIGKFESKIIKQKLISIIINWIGGKVFYTVNDSHYRFKLIYHGSIDGISNKSFKDKCKGQVESLILIKVKQSDKIFGGYSPIGFNSIVNNVKYFGDYTGNLLYYYSSDSFIFSFENSEDTHNMKISCVINHDASMIIMDLILVIIHCLCLIKGYISANSWN